MNANKKIITSVICFLSCLSLGIIVTSCRKKTTKDNTITKVTAKDKITNKTTTYKTTRKATTKANTTTHNYSMYEVNKEIFDSYFGGFEALSNLNLTLNYKEANTPGEYEGTIEIANNMILENYSSTKFIDNGKAFYNIKEYDSETNTITIDNSYFITKWNKPVEEKWKYYELSTTIFIPVFDFNQLTFNNETKNYEAATIETLYGTYENISISFLDDKLVSYSYQFTDLDDDSSVITCDVSKTGKTNVDNPIKNMVTKQTFNKFLGLNKNNLEDLNITINTSYNNYMANAEFDGNKCLITRYIYDTFMGYKMIYIKEIDDTINYDWKEQIEGTWSDTYNSNMEISDFVDLEFHLPVLNYDDFEFDYDTQTYKATESGDFKDITISFSDNKLVSIKSTRKSNSYTYESTITNVGATVVVDPQAE